MPWLAPITGYVDGKGRLFCAECCYDEHKIEPVYGDNSAFDDQQCERCGWTFPHIRTSEYVQVRNGFPTPELIRKLKIAA